MHAWERSSAQARGSLCNSAGISSGDRPLVRRSLRREPQGRWRGNTLTRCELAIAVFFTLGGVITEGEITGTLMCSELFNGTSYSSNGACATTSQKLRG
jgi:hypothetical protein